VCTVLDLGHTLCIDHARHIRGTAMIQPPDEPLAGYHPQRIYPDGGYRPAATADPVATAEPTASADSARTAIVLAGAALLTSVVALVVALAK